jgi:replicative DNA helicase
MMNNQRKASGKGTPAKTPMPSDEARQLPQCLEAERALLGSILIDNAALDGAVEVLDADDFYLESHRLLFGEMLTMMGRNQVIDLVTIGESLSSRGELEQAGGAGYIASLTDGVPHGVGSNVAEYCRIIQEKAASRNLFHLLVNSQSKVLDGLESASEIAEQAQAGIADIGEMKSGALMVPVKQALRKTAELIMGMEHGKPMLSGEPTGFGCLDDMTGGLQAGDMVVIAARPSEGKTSLALDIISNYCKRGEPAALLSLEMTKESVLLRMVCKEADVSLHKLRTGFTSKEENQRLVRAIRIVNAWPLWIADPSSLSGEAMACKLIGMVKAKRIKLAVVDYLQLLHARAENRTQEVSTISRQLKRAAHEIGKISGGCLIAVSQLARIGNNDELRLHHLRESGQIEQDADLVIFIYDDKRAADETLAEHYSGKIVKIAKQRNGLTGPVRMLFVKHLMTFRERLDVTEERRDRKMDAAGDSGGN